MPSDEKPDEAPKTPPICAVCKKPFAVGQLEYYVDPAAKNKESCHKKCVPPVEPPDIPPANQEPQHDHQIDAPKPETPAERNHGSTTWSARRLIGLSIDGLTAFSVAPLRLASLLGLLLAAAAFIFGVQILIETFVFGESVPGSIRSMLSRSTSGTTVCNRCRASSDEGSSGR